METIQLFIGFHKFYTKYNKFYNKFYTSSTQVLQFPIRRETNRIISNASGQNHYEPTDQRYDLAHCAEAVFLACSVSAELETLAARGGDDLHSSLDSAIERTISNAVCFSWVDEWGWK